MILTTKKVYSCNLAKKNETKTLFSIHDISAFIYQKSLKDKHYIIKVSNSADEVYYGENIGEVLDAIKYVFFMNHGTNIPVYELPDSDNVSKYAKSYKDVEKSRALIPDKKFLNMKQNIYVKGALLFDDDNKEIEDEIKQSIAVKRIKKKTVINKKYNVEVKEDLKT